MNNADGIICSTRSGNLWYWDTGGPGPTVVLLHAGTGSALSWSHQRDVFAAAGYRVIGYSRRGHHGSSPADSEDPGFAVTDLDELLTHLRLDRVHLVGEAAGGIYATDYTLAFPDRVASLVLASTVVGITDEDWRRAFAALQMPGFADLPAQFRELGPSYRAEHPDGVAAWVALTEMAYDGGAFVPQRVSSDICWAALERLSIPVLVIAGGADLMVPTPMLRWVARSLPNAELVTVADAGHSPSWERPAEFNRAVLRFLDRVTDRHS